MRAILLFPIRIVPIANAMDVALQPICEINPRTDRMDLQTFAIWNTSRMLMMSRRALISFAKSVIIASTVSKKGLY